MEKHKIITVQPETRREIETLVNKFSDRIESFQHLNYQEESVRVEFINPFFKALGWDMENKENLPETLKPVIHIYSQRTGGTTRRPDYAFRYGREKKFFVEAKKPAVDIFTDKKPAYQARLYSYNERLPITILTNFRQFAVYDYRITKDRPDLNDRPEKGRREFFTFEQYLDNLEFLTSTFSYEAAKSLNFDLYVEATPAKIKIGVDDDFLNTIETWRKKLALDVARNNLRLANHEVNYAVQATIDRIIFLRMAEDRGIEPPGQLQSLISGTNVYKRLFQLFQKCDDKYNSGLFNFKDDQVSLNLKIEDKTLLQIIDSLYGDDCPYIFSAWDADILGSVYERFLGKVIHLTPGHQARVEEKPEVKKAKGVFYTPKYIVEYIVKNTVDRLIEGKSPKQISSLKILDPACGSGSFLVNAYQHLLDYHLDYYTKNEPQKHEKEKRIMIGPDSSASLLIEEKKRILINNIFGVDLDPQAVEVTKLSLLLKVLENEDQDSINFQQKLFWKERALPDLDDNIKCGNSLIGSDFYKNQQENFFENDDERRKIKAFDWETEFKEIFKNGGFDVVIGNPPYVVLGADDFGLSYYKEKYSVAHGGKVNLYRLFIEKGFYLIKKLGYLGFICPSNYLSSADSIGLRQLLLNQTKLNEIIEYTEKDRVFSGVTQALTTIIFQKDREAKGNLHLVTSKHGDLTGDQGLFKNNEGLDFIFWDKAISRIREHKMRLSDIIEGYQGEINVSTNKDLFTNKPQKGFLPLLRGNQISSYLLLVQPMEYCPISADKRGHWARTRIAFQEVSNQQQDRRVRATAIDKNLLCGHTTNYCFSRDDRYDDLFILGLLNSKIANYYFSYFNNTNHVPIGEIKNIPIPTINLTDKGAAKIAGQISSLASDMLSLHKNLQSAKTPDEKTRLEREIKATDNQIDQLVYQLYGLTEEEIKIVESES